MRRILLSIIILSSVSVKAQNTLPADNTDNVQHESFERYSPSVKSITGKKWFLSKYSSISTGYSFFKGGSAGFVAAPLGLQLNRRLNNNLYAFAGVSAAPVYINFNNAYRSFDFNKTYPVNSLFKSSSLGMHARAELGLMYVNDAKTFSFSGSIGVQRSSYPVFPYRQMNTVRTIPK
ncbi:MAG TPA: hypothetical protein PKV73_14775 [Agriterribacter sp.]|nr:hypothetical protein [Agriterribacter sp.]